MPPFPAGEQRAAGAGAAVRERLVSLQLPSGYFVEVGGRVEQQERASQSLTIAIVAALIAVLALLYLALGSFAETGVILATIPSAFVGGIVALLIAGETWNVSSSGSDDRRARDVDALHPAGAADVLLVRSPSRRAMAGGVGR